MSSYKVEDDPVLQQLLHEHDHAYREHRRCSIELRRLHLNSATVDPIRSALLQQIAHEAALKLVDTTRALTDYGWELVPTGKTKEHLAKIDRAKSDTKTRIDSNETEKPRITIVQKVNGRIREYTD